MLNNCKVYPKESIITLKNETLLLTSKNVLKDGFSLDVATMKKVLLKAKNDVRRHDLLRQALIKKSLKVYVCEFPVHASFSIYTINTIVDLENSLANLLERQLTNVDNIKKFYASIEL